MPDLMHLCRKDNCFLLLKSAVYIKLHTANEFLLLLNLTSCTYVGWIDICYYLKLRRVDQTANIYCLSVAARLEHIHLLFKNAK